MRASLSCPLALALTAGLLTPACQRSDAKGPEQVCLRTVTPHAAKSLAVATFDEGAITPEEISQRILQMGSASQRGLTLEQKKGVVRRMAQNQILAYEAVKAGLQNDPEIAESVRGALVQRLLHREVEAQVPPPTETELQSFFEAHKTEFERQEMVHVYDLFLAAPRANPTKVAQVRKKVQALYEQLKAAPPGDFAVLGALAEKDNEDPRSRSTRGDLRLMSGKEFRASYPVEVATALDSLKAPGALSPPIQTDAGFYLLKVAQHTEAQAPSYDQLKSQLKSRVLFERRTAAFTRFLADAEARHHFQIVDSALARVGPSPEAPTVKSPPTTPPGVLLRPPAPETPRP